MALIVAAQLLMGIRSLLKYEGKAEWKSSEDLVPKDPRGSQAPPTWAAGPAPKNPDQAPASRLSLGA